MTIRSKTAFSRLQANGTAVAWLEFLALATLLAMLASQLDTTTILNGLERWVNSLGHPYNHLGRDY